MTPSPSDREDSHAADRSLDAAPGRDVRAPVASESYNDLHQTRSYAELALQFVFRMYRFKGYFDSEERKNAEMLAPQKEEAGQQPAPQ